MSIYISAVTPQPKEVQRGTAVTLSCVVTDITAAVTTLWKKSGSSDLSSVTGYTVVQGTLVFFQTTTLALTAAVNTADTTYTCVVTTGDGTVASTLVQLNVFG